MPTDGTARPGVLVVGGSDGGLSEGMAALLASHGFAALALAYFRAEPCARSDGNPTRVLRDSHPLARPPAERGGGRSRRGRPSRGGELALLLAATFPEITAVVGYVPSGVVHAGIAASPAPGGAPRSAWTYRGRPLPFVPPPIDGRPPGPTVASPEAPLELTPMFLKSLEDRTAVEAAAIFVERIRGPVRAHLWRGRSSLALAGPRRDRGGQAGRPHARGDSPPLLGSRAHDRTRRAAGDGQHDPPSTPRSSDGARRDAGGQRRRGGRFLAPRPPVPARPSPRARATIRAHLLRWRPRLPCHATREIVEPTHSRLRGPDMAPHSPCETTPRAQPSGAASQLDPSHRSSHVSPTGS